MPGRVRSRRDYRLLLANLKLHDAVNFDSCQPALADIRRAGRRQRSVIRGRIRRTADRHGFPAAPHATSAEQARGRHVGVPPALLYRPGQLVGDVVVLRLGDGELVGVGVGRPLVLGLGDGEFADLVGVGVGRTASLQPALATSSF